MASSRGNARTFILSGIFFSFFGLEGRRWGVGGGVGKWWGRGSLQRVVRDEAVKYTLDCLHFAASGNNASSNKPLSSLGGLSLFLSLVLTKPH